MRNLQKWDRYLAFTAPKMVVVQDWKVGLAHKCLQFFFVIFIFSDLVENKKYLAEIPAEGFAGFWASEGNLLSDQVATLESMSRRVGRMRYCDRTAHPYFEDLPMGKYYDSVCELQDYNQLHIKGENELFIQTSFVQSTVNTQDCTLKDSIQSFSSPCTLNRTEVFDGATGSSSNSPKECECAYDRTRYAGSMTGTENELDRCTCIARRHVFTPGVESMSINFEAGMSAMWPKGFGQGCSGSTVLTKPKLFVRKKDSKENLYIFEKGQKLSLPVSTLLELIGMSGEGLDAENSVAKATGTDGSVAISSHGLTRRAHEARCSEGSSSWPVTTSRRRGSYVSASNRPTFCDSPWSPTSESLNAEQVGRVPTWRQTGIAISMNVRFEHECGKDDETTAVVEISNRNIAWNSKGSSTENTHYSSTTRDDGRIDTKYLDTYKFGLKIVFTFSGRSTRTDVFVILSKVAEAFMFVMISSSIMAIVTFYLVPNAKFYKTRRTEEVQFDVVNARLAAQTAMAINSFQQFDLDRNGKLSKAELMTAFRSKYPEDVAESMTNHVMNIGDRNKNGVLEFSEFMHVIVEDQDSHTIMLDTLKPEFKKPVEGEKSAALPAPFQDWEERVTPQGMKYFANNATKTTSWNHPALMAGGGGGFSMVRQMIPATMQQPQMMMMQGGNRIVPQMQPQPQMMVQVQQGAQTTA